MKKLFACTLLFVVFTGLCPAGIYDEPDGFVKSNVPNITIAGANVTPGKINTNLDFIIPDQKIIVPDNVEAGDVVTAKVGPISKVPQYLVAATYRWKVLQGHKEKKNVQEWPDGSSIIFGAGNKEGVQYTILLSASYLYLVKEKSPDGKTEKVTTVAQRAQVLIAHVLVGKAPEPDPDPNPNPPVPPSFPDGKYGLAKKSYDAAMASVPSGARKAGVPLANSFKGIASSIKAGVLKDASSILKQTQTSNQSALSSVQVSNKDWDTFFNQLQKELYPLYTSNKLVTPDHYADAWNEVAAGLEKVK
jgi:hypothetical protein